MRALGSLSAFEDIQALLKSKLGEFLAAEQKLRTMQVNPSITIRSQAAALLAEQKVLEGELGSAQTRIAQFQKGAWSLSDAIALGDVGTRLLTHLGKVANLERSAGGVMMPSIGISPIPVLGAVVAAAVLFLFLRPKAA